MSDNAEQVGEEIASVITDAVEAADAERAIAESVNKQLVEAAVEGERAKRVDDLEKDLAECLANQAEMLQAFQGMALQQEQMAGQLLTLTTLLPSAILPEATNQNGEGDGPQENQEAQVEEVTIIAPEAEQVQVPPVADEKPPRKKKRWI